MLYLLRKTFLNDSLVPYANYKVEVKETGTSIPIRLYIADGHLISAEGITTTDDTGTINCYVSLDKPYTCILRHPTLGYEIQRANIVDPGEGAAVPSGSGPTGPTGLSITGPTGPGGGGSGSPLEANLIESAYDYNPDGTVSVATDTYLTGVMTTTYTYTDGNLTQAVIDYNGSTRTETYTYNGSNQLTDITAVNI